MLSNKIYEKLLYEFHIQCLTHFMPLASFYTPRKHQKTRGCFDAFSGLEATSGMQCIKRNVS